MQGALMGRLPDDSFWLGKRVFITGHTGFKGTWLTHWLHRMGVRMKGYSLPPETIPNMFVLTRAETKIETCYDDIRSSQNVRREIANFQPEIIFHLAAQPLVRTGYEEPVCTFETNLIGTINLLEAVRECPSVRVVVVVTSDKCYDNPATIGGCREDDKLGGQDPYSASKACAEIATHAYSESFFGRQSRCAVASVRSGNVIGGGDWGKDRLIPDVMRSFEQGVLALRNPASIRPWQFVLEPLSGYLLLAEQLYLKGREYCGGWNFGPALIHSDTVLTVAQRFIDKMGIVSTIRTFARETYHESPTLLLDSSRAKQRLGWHPRWDLDTALTQSAEWYKSYLENPLNLDQRTLNQIDLYVAPATP